MTARTLQARLNFWRAKVPTVFRGTKFLLVAWLGMFVNTGYLYLFKGVLGIRIIPASLMAIEIAIIHNFIWFRHWAWKDRQQKYHQPFFKQLFKYNIATGLVDLFSNVTILWVLSTFFHVHYLLANICGMIAGPFIKFWLNDKFIFREKRHDPAG
jgi:dolichol-phosphate mannosyltransferase